MVLRGRVSRRAGLGRLTSLISDAATASSHSQVFWADGVWPNRRGTDEFLLFGFGAAV